jgi:S-adenosylmethionine hydrolase
MKNPPLIALLTDFGISDPYVASMKGVLYTKVPGVTIADISHAVPPQDIRHAAYVLWRSYRYFPSGTIFVAVVDPGVGSTRRILIGNIEGYVFVFPDNGILDLILQTANNVSLSDVNVAKHFATASTTFHGRDIFAPVAAYIATRHPISAIARDVPFKPPVNCFVDTFSPGKKKFNGSVIHIDSFGNIITNIVGSRVLKKTSTLVFNNGKKVTGIYQTYSEAKSKTPFMIIGSSGLIEVSVKNGNAAVHLGIHHHSSVTLTL